MRKIMKKSHNIHMLPQTCEMAKIGQKYSCKPDIIYPQTYKLCATHPPSNRENAQKSTCSKLVIHSFTPAVHKRG